MKYKKQKIKIIICKSENEKYRDETVIKLHNIFFLFRIIK